MREREVCRRLKRSVGEEIVDQDAPSTACPVSNHFVTQ
jgi:hypothetical protein